MRSLMSSRRSSRISWLLLPFVLAGCHSELLQLKDPTDAVDPNAASDATLRNRQAYERIVASAPRFVRYADRSENQSLVEHNTSDYAPSVLQEDGKYKMWWCGDVAGSHILYAEATQITGPWTSRDGSRPFDDVFQPTGDALRDTFDGADTCDPSVVHNGNSYYMYYSGRGRAAPYNVTMWGAASSPDGLTWTRLRNGQPIERPAFGRQQTPNPYGAGQPSVVYLNGLYYLSYTDTTGADSNPDDGAGIYVLRSPDPAFERTIEELGPGGFHPRTDGEHTRFALRQSFNVDWAYIDSLDMFALSTHEGAGLSRLIMYDPNLRQVVDESISFPAPWQHGPGLLADRNKHAMTRGDLCGRVDIDIVHAGFPAGGYDKNASGWDLMHSGTTVHDTSACERPDLAMRLDGSRIRAPGLPLAVVVGGKRLEFERDDAAVIIAPHEQRVTQAQFLAIPYAATVRVGAELLGASGRPGAFYDPQSQRRWAVGCRDAIVANSSSVRSVSPAEWDAIASGGQLRCLGSSAPDARPSLAEQLEGFRISAPDMPVTVVVHGTRLQFERAETAAVIAPREKQISAAEFNSIPYGGLLRGGTEVIGADGHGPAFYDRVANRLWPIGCLSAILANESSINIVMKDEYIAIPVAARIDCPDGAP